MESNKDDAELIAQNMLAKNENYHQNEFAVIIDGREFNKKRKPNVEGDQNLVFPMLDKDDFG